jgi:hypothetical protein
MTPGSGSFILDIECILAYNEATRQQRVAPMRLFLFLGEMNAGHKERVKAGEVHEASEEEGGRQR